MKDFDDVIFKLRALNATVGILATVTSEGTKNVEVDSEAIADALYSVTHSLDAVIADAEEITKDTLTIKFSKRTMLELSHVLDEERKRGKADIDYKERASMLLADAIGWRYAELFQPVEEPELSDEELDALGIPVVCIAK